MNAILRKIIESDELSLTCAQVAPLLHADAATIHMQAQQRPELLGFPVVCYGSRVRIPRIPFLQFFGIAGCCTEKGEAALEAGTFDDGKM